MMDRWMDGEIKDGLIKQFDEYIMKLYKDRQIMGNWMTEGKTESQRNKRMAGWMNGMKDR